MAKKQNKAEVNASQTEEKKPKARKTAKKAEKQQNLEDILFECRNKLRGNANMTTKRDMLLTLVFLRLICSRFNEQKEKIKSDVLTNLGKAEDALSAEERDFVALMQENKSSFEQDGVFYLQDGYNWERLVTLPASERAIALDNGITQLMEAEKNLKNALPANLFVNARLEPSVLKGVMDDINKIDPRNFKDIDLIGRVYEYFLQQFAVNATKEDGEFYTPQSIVELIAHLIEPYDGTIYDPCCGSGGMFVQSVRLIEAHGGNKRNVSVYGQESDPDTYRLAKMNLAARGISYHLGDSNASSFTNDKHPDLRANYIMANPPFNRKAWRTEEQLTKDIRWSGYGLPPVSNANYAWILHMLYHLDSANGIAGFLLSNGALEDEDTLAIREQLIRNDKVEAIFILPREMFYSTDTSVTLWILNQNKKGGIRNGRQLRNRENEVLFVDLRTWNQHNSTIKTDKSKKTFVVFNEEQIKAICDIYHGWQTYTEMEAYDKPELYHAAYIDEIEANGWSLTPSRYIKFEDKSVILHKKNIINNSSNVVCGYNQIVKVVEFETKGFYECRNQIEKDITIINNANTTIESMINVAGAANESTMFYESMILEAPIQGANDDKDKKMTFSNGTSTTDPNDKEKKNKKSNILKAINSYMKVSADIISSKMKIMSRMYYDYYYILEYYIDELGDAENVAKSNGTTQVKL